MTTTYPYSSKPTNADAQTFRIGLEEGVCVPQSIATTADEETADAIADRAIPLEMRADLRIQRRSETGTPVVLVSDPLSLQHHRFHEQEFAILCWLDGNRSSEELKRLFARQFAPYQLSTQEIETYLVHFYEKNLLQSRRSGLGAKLESKARRAFYRSALARWKNPFAVRLPGIDPTPLLESLRPCLAWLFQARIVGCMAAIMVATCLWLTTHWENYSQRLPVAAEFFSARNGACLVLTLMATKVLHEIGHGIAALRWGVRCQELGISLMLGMPTLYINTSQSWVLPNKWQRITIAMAGVYFELIAATIATWIWALSGPGWMEFVALNIMTTCTVATILFNGNPLLKYDGYFALSDWLEIPNLQERASRYFRDCFLWLAMGVPVSSERNSSQPTRTRLLAYALSSYCFRLSVLASIGLVLCSMGRWVGLESLMRWVMAIAFSGMVIAPILSVARFLHKPSQRRLCDGPRSRVSILAGMVLVSALLFLPLPSAMVLECSLEPSQSINVYAAHEGVLEQVVAQPGVHVMNGSPVLKLRNIDLEIEIERLRGELLECERRASDLRADDRTSASDALQWKELQASIAGKRHTLEVLERTADQMTCVAPSDGIIRAHWTEPEPESSVEELGLRDRWSIPLSMERPVFRKGDLLYKVESGDEKRARLVVPQDAISRIQVGQEAQIIFDANPYRTLRGRITAIAGTGVDKVDASVALMRGGNIETVVGRVEANARFSSSPSSKPRETTFEAWVEWPSNTSGDVTGHHGVVRLDCPWEPLGQRIVRWLHRYFRIEL